MEIIRAKRQPEEVKWEFSHFDKVGLHVMLRGTWIFDYQPDMARLKQSLGETLNDYPHLCGRVSRGGFISLSNEGIPFITRSQSNLTVAEVINHPQDVDQFCEQVSPIRIKRGKCAPIKVTLTLLKDGCVLCIRANHSCLDGIAFYSFVDTWSRIYRGESVMRPLLDQSVLPAVSSRTKKQAIADAANLGWSPFGLPVILKAIFHMRRGTFKHRTSLVTISYESIETLRQQLTTETGLPLSRHEVICAHVMKLWQALFDYSADIQLKHVSVLNARNRLSNVPSNFVGNSTWNPVSATVAAGDSVATIADAIHRGLAPYRETPSTILDEEIQLSMDLAHHKAARLPHNFSETLKPKPKLVYVNNFCSAKVYTPDFGGGTPVAVIPHDVPDPVLIWPAPPPTGGVKIYLSAIAAIQYNRLGTAHPFFNELQPLAT